jgi:DNA-binding GntR family transcriptional regulator
MDALTRAVRESTDFPSIRAPRANNGTAGARRSGGTRPRAGSDAVRQRGELQAQVARLLRIALMTGQFVPGQTLSLRQLAQMLGTSPMPVRGVLGQMIASGVLETQANGSVAVARMTEPRFVELTRVRKALEGMAAEMACRNATPRLITDLEKINARLHRSIASRDILACLRLNQAFHFTLYSASASEILPSLIESLWLRAGPFMYFSLTAPTTPWDATGHQTVIDCLRKGNARATRTAIERDIDGSATYLLKKSSAFRSGIGAALDAATGVTSAPRKRAVRR